MIFSESKALGRSWLNPIQQAEAKAQATAEKLKAEADPVFVSMPHPAAVHEDSLTYDVLPPTLPSSRFRRTKVRPIVTRLVEISGRSSVPVSEIDESMHRIEKDIRTADHALGHRLDGRRIADRYEDALKILRKAIVLYNSAPTAGLAARIRERAGELSDALDRFLEYYTDAAIESIPDIRLFDKEEARRQAETFGGVAYRITIEITNVVTPGASPPGAATNLLPIFIGGAIAVGAAILLS